MNAEEFKRLANNPKYIPGIYNYCDRWCERCPFTGLCLNYELSENQFTDLESRDLNNKKFWDKLSEVFKITLELIEEEAKELGIDVYNFEDESDENTFEVKEKLIENNRNLRQAEKYIILVDKWFKVSEQEFLVKQEQLILEENLELEGTTPYEHALSITDAVEVIKWYQYQIFVKIKRALYSIFDKEVFEDVDQIDSNGSAKIALIGIDRSIGAWGKLYNHFNSKQDEILDILLHLSRLRDNLEIEFPKARSFKRVGFDD